MELTVIICFQRVVTESRDISPPSGSAAFDYLYEFSETRKVLEEFFRCPAVTGHGQLNSNDEIVNFQVGWVTAITLTVNNRSRIR